MKDYNFFERTRQKREKDVSTGSDSKSSVLVFLFSLILILGTSGGLVLKNKLASSKLESEKEELLVIESSEAYRAADVFQKKIELLDQYDAGATLALERIEKGKILNTGLLSTISNQMPENTHLIEATVTRTYTTFRFYTPSLSAAAELLNSLDNSGLFVSTSLVSIDKDNNEEIGYIAEISVVMKVGEE